jgi:hypothetical protein
MDDGFALKFIIVFGMLHFLFAMVGCTAGNICNFIAPEFYQSVKKHHPYHRGNSFIDDNGGYIVRRGL